MAEDNRLSIGRVEDVARKRDIASVKRGDMELGVAQQNCRIRALASGAFNRKETH